MIINLVLLAIIINGVQSNVQLFKCRDTKYCRCIGQEEMLCSQDGDFQDASFLLDIRPKEFIVIHCQPVADSSSYALLPNLSIGPLESITFKMCLLPQNESLSYLVQSLGITSLKTLVFQTHRNLKSSLTRSHLTGLSEVTKLVLSSNGLTDLPQDLFMDMENMKTLDLRANNVNLSKGIFDNLSKLDYLELGVNEIRQLPPEIFKNLGNLHQLNLWYNSIKLIPKELFIGLSQLKALDLSSNQIEYFDTDAFQYLPNLTVLHLTANNISSLPSELFQYNKNLTLFKLSDNKHSLMTLGDYLLANLTLLTNVTIDNCKLQYVPEHLFENSINITKIDFSHNNLQTLPELLFHTQDKLTVLFLNHNNLTFLPVQLFSSLKNLQTLDISYNNIEDIPIDFLSGLKNLKELNLASNNLHQIDHDAFSSTSQLIVLNLANNYLQFVTTQFIDPESGSYSPFKSLIKLEHLNLQNNSVTSIYTDWRLSLALKTLNLSHNKIKAISFQSDLHFLSNSIVVDLSNNLISRIDLVMAEQIAQLQSSNISSVDKTHVKVILDFNPLHCDCYAYHFIRYLEGTLSPLVRNMVELAAHNLSCTSPEALKGVQVTRVDPKKIVCFLDHPSSEIKRCPKECTCTVRTYDTVLVVNCSYAGLSHMPPLVDFQSTKLNFTELYIQGNKLNSLPYLNHTGYIHVRKINAEYNNISMLTNANIPPNIEVLQLAHNNLMLIDSSVFSSLGNKTKIRKITLGSNPWLCNCKSKDLLLYMQSNYQTVEGLANITCFGKQWSELSPNDLCPLQQTLIIVTSVFIALFGVLIGISAALYYYYEQEIKVWLFAHNMCLWFVTEEELDKDKIYDAFISYSHKDEDFVTEHLIPNLEECENPFKLCLHDRDWIAGEWIPTQIARSVEDSKRTVVVLSPNFLESVWGKMEFRTAHNNALSEGRARVIIIIYGDIGPVDNLDPELKAYLSTNTYVEWGDPWFWNKLRYGLPHPSKHTRVRKLTNTNLENKLYEDKIDLIHTVHKNGMQVQNGDIKTNGVINGGFITNVNGSVKQSDV